MQVETAGFQVFVQSTLSRANHSLHRQTTASREIAELSCHSMYCLVSTSFQGRQAAAKQDLAMHMPSQLQCTVTRHVDEGATKVRQERNCRVASNERCCTSEGWQTETISNLQLCISRTVVLTSGGIFWQPASLRLSWQSQFTPLS